MPLGIRRPTELLVIAIGTQVCETAFCIGCLRTRHDHGVRSNVIFLRVYAASDSNVMRQVTEIPRILYYWARGCQPRADVPSTSPFDVPARGRDRGTTTAFTAVKDSSL